MAYVLSSISGNLISAASAGFAPTNSSEVSAIASAYQVVSATATQLYAGTAYVTSINEAPVSAARAGNSVNATLATSAYYDGTGRLISALPDSAAVSAIASSYAESAASSKQDTLTFGYDTSDKISSINGSSLAGEGGGLVTAIETSENGISAINNSGLVDTAALHSADYSSLYVQEPLYISASGDSSYISISGNVGGVDSATCSAIASAYAESAVSSVSGNYYTTANESGFLTAQAQASWSESASASPSYIQDKPDLVDIVAGPGIVIDNPDGNTLRVSVAQDIEVVLWEGSLTDANCMQAFDLNDNPFNFEYLRFYWNVDNCSMVTEGRVITGNADVCSDFGWFYQNWKTIKNLLRFTAPVGSTPANAQFIEGISYAQSTSSANMSDFRHNWSYCFRPLVKIVGVHRIANN